MGLTVVQQAAELQGAKMHNVTDAARKSRVPLLCLEGAVVQQDALSPTVLRAGREGVGGLQVLAVLPARWGAQHLDYQLHGPVVVEARKEGLAHRCDQDPVPGCARECCLHLPLLVERPDEVRVEDVAQHNPGDVEQHLQDLATQGAASDQQPGVDFHQHAVGHAPLVMGVVVGNQHVECCADVVTEDDDWALHRLGVHAHKQGVQQEIHHRTGEEHLEALACSQIEDVLHVQHCNDDQVEPVVQHDWIPAARVH